MEDTTHNTIPIPPESNSTDIQTAAHSTHGTYHTCINKLVTGPEAKNTKEEIKLTDKTRQLPTYRSGKNS